MRGQLEASQVYFFNFLPLLLVLACIELPTEAKIFENNFWACEEIQFLFVFFVLYFESFQRRLMKEKAMILLPNEWRTEK